MFRKGLFLSFSQGPHTTSIRPWSYTRSSGVLTGGQGWAPPPLAS